jgi:hypothetical protein
MNSPRISYPPRADTSLKRNALASIYARAVQRYQEAIGMNKGARTGAPERPERIKDDPARSILHE